jgi:hypothetical protein
MRNMSFSMTTEAQERSFIRYIVRRRTWREVA